MEFGRLLSGDYSLEWQVEAAQRGLANLKMCVLAVEKLVGAKNAELHDGISHEEVRADGQGECRG